MPTTYGIEDDLNEVKTDLIKSLTKTITASVDAGMEKVGDAFTKKHGMYIRADFASKSEAEQNAVLKHLTKVEGLTQEDAGKLCGLAQPTVCTRLKK